MSPSRFELRTSTSASNPSAPHANPGNENLTVFTTIQNAMDHYRVVYINTELSAELNPAGWNDWGNPAN